MLRIQSLYPIYYVSIAVQMRRLKASTLPDSGYVAMETSSYT